MKFDMQKYYDWTVVLVNGRIDFDICKSFCQSFSETFSDRTQKVALDMTAIEFLNLPTIRFLNDLAAEFKSGGGALAVFGGTDRMRKHIEIFGDMRLICVVRKKHQLLEAIDLQRMGKNTSLKYEDYNNSEERADFSLVKESAL